MSVRATRWDLKRSPKAIWWMLSPSRRLRSVSSRR
jgi:hypothetical protein